MRNRYVIIAVDLNKEDTKKYENIIRFFNISFREQRPVIKTIIVDYKDKIDPEEFNKATGFINDVFIERKRKTVAPVDDVMSYLLDIEEKFEVIFVGSNGNGVMSQIAEELYNQNIYYRVAVNLFHYDGEITQEERDKYCKPKERELKEDIKKFRQRITSDYVTKKEKTIPKLLSASTRTHEINKYLKSKEKEIENKVAMYEESVRDGYKEREKAHFERILLERNLAQLLEYNPNCSSIVYIACFYYDWLDEHDLPDSLYAQRAYDSIRQDQIQYEFLRNIPIHERF